MERTADSPVWEDTVTSGGTAGTNHRRLVELEKTDAAADVFAEWRQRPGDVVR